MPTMFDRPASDRCANCGGPVSTTGRPPRSGKRFCSQRPCRAAKAVVDRARLADNRDAPSSCTGCGAGLAPRLWRSGDEFGRWCRKASCRGRRREAREALANIDLTKQISRLQTQIDILTDAVLADAEGSHLSRRHTCLECGLTTALLGWVHPGDPLQETACFGTLDGAPKKNPTRDGIMRAWPFALEFLDEAQRKTLRDMD